MDLVQIGKFIAQLRKERELSQEKLGEILGVTNKTISRWETGTYLPPAEMLLFAILLPINRRKTKLIPRSEMERGRSRGRFI